MMPMISSNAMAHMGFLREGSPLFHYIPIRKPLKSARVLVARKINKSAEQLSRLTFDIVTDVGLGLPRRVPMPNKLVIGFLGMMVGGSAFLVTGLAISLMVGQLQDRPTQTAAQPVQIQYAQLSH